MQPGSTSPFHTLFKEPSRRVELCFWALLFLSLVGIRLYFIHLLPVALWTKDTTSYAESAFTWVHTGVWETDPRRGAIYSLFIAFCCKAFGTVNAVMVCQHLLGALAILFSMIAARLTLGRRALVPLMLCGISYAFFGWPLYLEHLLRNETLLFFFGSLTFGSWLLALHREKTGWLWLTGISAALLTLTKNVYAPFPLLLMGGYLFFFRANLQWALRQALVFALAFALPLLANKVLHSVTPHTRPPEPQDGILFYGRTAQFTVLEKGKYPELKAAIAQEVEDYRKLPRLDNNLILKRTVVPHLERLLTAQGKLPADLNRLCWELGLEGVNAHRVAYVRQVFADMQEVLINSTAGNCTPTPEDLDAAQKTVQETPLHNDPLTDLPGSVKELQAAAHPGHFNLYRAFISASGLFRFRSAALWATLLLPVFFWRTKGPYRLWWLGLCGVWFFTVVLLCTVGRPLHRYIIPALPILFWTFTSALALLWEYLSGRFGPKETPEPQPAGTTPPAGNSEPTT